MTHLQDFLAAAPLEPGVYCMFDAAGQLLYVGKARSLKLRLAHYLQKHLDTPKTTRLMAQVVDIQFTIAANENEALLLEANIIKKYQPRYNVLLRDDKSYPYLLLTTDTPFPRLDYHRGAKQKTGRYFGPYPSAGSVRDNLALIQKLFQLRQCSDTFFRSRQRPCLQYHIKRCTAPCVGLVTAEAYQKQVESAILFLEGKSAVIMEQLVEKMQQSAKQLHYEQAAIYRDQISKLRQLTARQSMIGETGQNVDVLAYVQQGAQVAIAILFVRAGRVIGHKTFCPRVPREEATPDEVLSEFIPQYYLSPLHRAEGLGEIVCDQKLAERAWLEEGLQQALHSTVKLIDSPKSSYRNWLLMAKANAQYGLVQRVNKKRGSAVDSLRAVQQALHLPNPIQRIECFDVSHLQGEATVAACVVYGVEGALNQQYRHFNIRKVAAGDDYAALAQVLSRRYIRLKKEQKMLPDLVIVDGGMGQLKRAERVFESLQIAGVELIAVAKGRSRKPGLETVIRSESGQHVVVELEKEKAALKLIQFVRDEAHRFAIRAHRAKRKQLRSLSPLEHIEGIGAKRRQQLLQYFGGLQGLQRAGVEEIAQTPGVSLRLAQRVYNALR